MVSHELQVQLFDMSYVVKLLLGLIWADTVVCAQWFPMGYRYSCSLRATVVRLSLGLVWANTVVCARWFPMGYMYSCLI